MPTRPLTVTTPIDHRRANPPNARWSAIPLSLVLSFACGDAGSESSDTDTVAADTSDTSSTGDTTGTAGETSETTTASTTSDTDSTTGGEGEPIEWGPCPDGFRTECALVEVPLDWDDPEAKTIEILIARQPAPSGSATAQLWFLQGGPGDSADFYDEVVEGLGPFMQDVDLYVFEHRGVGESTRLGCPAQESPDSPEGVAIAVSEWPGCLAAAQAEWGDQLTHFNTTNAAEDLAHVIDRTREGDQLAFAYTVSYGTYVAQRLQQLDPFALDGVILDGVVAPGSTLISDFHTYADPVLADIAELCAADSVCAEKMGADPLAAIAALYDDIDNDHCMALGLDSATMRDFVSKLVASHVARAHIMPLVYRIARCEPADIAAVANYVTAAATLFGDVDPNSPGRRSSILHTNISLSEMWSPEAPTLAERETACDSLLACSMSNLGQYAIQESWPTYDDPLAGAWPDFQIPVLAIHGQLDPQTPEPLGALIAEHLSPPAQEYVSIPYAPHGTLFFSPDEDPLKPACGMQMMFSFLSDPAAEVDKSCLETLAPLSFAGDPVVVEAFFGTPDPWEN